ncbi:hypothetical protein AN958_12172 [Leucoagaricus sp. SymC.cos]|nr:hypothetical protein AN958_12172 [Leucoagaricus sp. SymC.cos]
MPPTDDMPKTRYLRFRNTLENAKKIADLLVSETIQRESRWLESHFADKLPGPKFEAKPNRRSSDSLAQQRLLQRLPTLLADRRRLANEITDPLCKGPLNDARGRLAGIEANVRETLEELERLAKAQKPPRIRFLAENKRTKRMSRGIPQPVPLNQTDFPDGPDLQAHIETAVVELAKNAVSRSSFASAFENASREDSQLMVDYLNLVLHQPDVFLAENGKSILRLLCKLAKRAGVYPHRYTLEGLEKEQVPCDHGGFADIYKGKYKDRNLCVKVIRCNSSNMKNILKDTAKEMLLWAHVSHQNILPFYGVYAFDSPTRRLCLVSPWMDHGNLYEYLKNNPKSNPSSRIWLLRDIVSGLLHLHEKGIVHGDLKEANILVSAEERALIGDFGLSTIAMTVTMGYSKKNGGPAAFTPRWSAPEIIHRIVSAPTAPTDIWSYGCLCFKVLTDKEPFHRCTLEQSIPVAHIKGEKPHQPRGLLWWKDDACKNLDSWVSRLMVNCWESNPDKRPTSKIIQGIFDDHTGDSRDERKQSEPIVQPEDKLGFWHDMKAHSDNIDIDVSKVKDLLLKVRASSRLNLGSSRSLSASSLPSFTFAVQRGWSFA